MFRNIQINFEINLNSEGIWNIEGEIKKQTIGWPEISLRLTKGQHFKFLELKKEGLEGLTYTWGYVKLAWNRPINPLKTTRKIK